MKVNRSARITQERWRKNWGKRGKIGACNITPPLRAIYQNRQLIRIRGTVGGGVAWGTAKAVATLVLRAIYFGVGDESTDPTSKI